MTLGTMMRGNCGERLAGRWPRCAPRCGSRAPRRCARSICWITPSTSMRVPTLVCADMNTASSWKNSRSSASDARMCGRCTFTTTSRPPRMRAPCTCPRLAVPSGSGSKKSNSLLIRPPSSSSMICSTSSNGMGPTSSWSVSSSRMYGLGQQVRAGGEHLAELHVRRSELDEPLPEADGVRLLLGDLLGLADPPRPGASEMSPCCLATSRRP